MPDMHRTVLITLLAGAMFTAGARGQHVTAEGQHLALSGLTAVQARITVQWDMAITMRGGSTSSEFEKDLTHFELDVA